MKRKAGVAVRLAAFAAAAVAEPAAGAHDIFVADPNGMNTELCERAAPPPKRS